MLQMYEKIWNKECRMRKFVGFFTNAPSSQHNTLNHNLLQIGTHISEMAVPILLICKSAKHCAATNHNSKSLNPLAFALSGRGCSLGLV